MKIKNSLKHKNKSAKPAPIYKREIRISDCITVKFRNDDADGDGPDSAEIFLYDDIGKDPWSGTGISAEDFAKALKEVPRDKEILLRVNSLGGDVHTGMAIHNMLCEWPNKVTARIDGVAASTASWIPMACDSVEMPETAQMFIHDAFCYAAGNADDLRATAEMLDKTSNQIAGMYAAKNGKPMDEMRALMKSETLMTGKEAKDLGLVDTLTSDEPARNFADAELKAMRNKLHALRNASPSSEAQPRTHKTGAVAPNPIMNRSQMIALLNRFKVAIPENATDADLLKLCNELAAPEQPQTQTQPQPVNNGNGNGNGNSSELVTSLQHQVNELTKERNAAKKSRIENAIQKAIDDDKIPANQKDAWVTRAMSDETILNDFEGMPSRPPGAENLAASRVELTGESFNDVQSFILKNGPQLTGMFIGGTGSGRRIDDRTKLDLQNRAIKVANAVKKHRNMLISMFNTNTIDANLQRTVILFDLVRAYAIRMLPLKAFCTTFSNVPLEGNNQVAVPYFPLQAADSTDFNAGEGYVAGDTEQDSRLVTVNKRKYQAMKFSSQELRRQPYQNWQELAAMNAEKLAVDVNKDVLSIITAANYGAAVKTTPAAAFSGDDVADLYGAATDLNWPDENRSLVLTTGYKVGLLKDPTFRQYLSYGDTDPLRKAQIKEAYGFEDIYTVPTANFPANNEHLTGFITHKAAALVATAPIIPAPAVRAVMIQYDMVVDPDTGIAIEYRLFGNAQMDNTIEVVESNYGYAAGVQTALARITSQ